jgi:hypothetical protein
MKTNDVPKFLRVLLWIMLIGTIIVGYLLIDTMFSKHPTYNHYVITRSNDYPPKVVKIAKEYKMMQNTQFVPTKAYVRIGLDYFCTVEMVDSSFLVDYTQTWLGNFHYEGLRYKVWELIELSKDSAFQPSKDVKEDCWISVCAISCFYKTSQELPDTIEYMGLRIYNIEPWTFEKYLEKIPVIYEEPEFEGKQTY